MAESEYNTTVDPEHVRQLRKFKADNSYGIYKTPEDDSPSTDQEIRGLLIYAANYAAGDLSLPRNLEAMRVVRLVPEDVGAALFQDFV